MAKDQTDIEEIDELDVIPNAFLTEVKGDTAVSSSMFERIFLPSARIPKEIIDRVVSSPEAVRKMMLADEPLYQTVIEKPYWKSQEEERGFSRIDVDIFGSVCLADDRHLLDCIIAHGSLINDAHKYTLRQIASYPMLNMTDIVWDYVGNQDAIDQRLLNRGVYFHVAFDDLCRSMGVRNQKKTRKNMIKRLQRLSIMHLRLIPVYRGEQVTAKSVPVQFVDREFWTLCDAAKVRNNQHNSETETDLIVNISDYYYRSLEKDGVISRKRLKNHYIHLTGKNNIEDLYKYLDTHKRQFLNNKMLSKMIMDYLDNKMSLFGINRFHKHEALFKQLVENRIALAEHFNIILLEVGDDFKMIYEEDNQRVLSYIDEMGRL